MAVHAPITPARGAKDLTRRANFSPLNPVLPDRHIAADIALQLQELLHDCAVVARSSRIGPNEWADRLHAGFCDIMQILAEELSIAWDIRTAMVAEAEQLQLALDRCIAGLSSRYDTSNLIAGACDMHKLWLSRSFAGQESPPDTPASRQRSLFRRMTAIAWNAQSDQHPS